MTFLPVVERELRAASRRRSTFRTRIVFAVVAVGVAAVVVTITGAAPGGARAGGGWLLGVLTVMALGFCSFAGVFLTADCLSEEKREGTLGLLFLTDLKGYDVVLGKLMATSVSAFYGLLAVFPVLAITLTVGGVTPGEFWRLALVFINTLFLSLTAGMFVSAISRRDHRAMGGTFWLMVLIVAVLPVTERMLAYFGVVPPLTLSLPSPVTATRLAKASGYVAGSGSFWQSLLFMQLLGWLFLVLAGILLPKLWQEKILSNPTRPRSAEYGRSETSQSAAKRARMLDENPVFWLSSRAQSASGNIVLACLLVLVAAWFAFQFDGALFSGGLHYVGLIVALLLKISVGLRACRFFVEARRSGSLELLLATPLTASEVLRGQWLALRRLYLAPAVSVLCLFAMPVVFAVASDPLSYLRPRPGVGGVWLLEMATFVADLFAIGWLGMLLGLITRKPHFAPGLTLLYGVLLPLVAVCIPKLLIDVPLILWARDKLHRELRTSVGQRCAPMVAPLYGPGGRASAPVPPVIRS